MNPREIYKTLIIGRPDGSSAAINFYKPPVTEVEFISGTSIPISTLIKTTRGYSGVHSSFPPSDEDRDKFLDDIQKTPLGTPLEMINIVLLITGIPRSTTHQLVRTRIGASVVQESTRFLGSKSRYDFLVTKENMNLGEEYYDACAEAISNYERFLHLGMSNQDARLILPHSIMTNLFWGISLKTLMYVYRQRVCCNAETSVWVPLMLQIKDVIGRKYSTVIADMLKSNVEEEKSCGYDASFDRPCHWSNGVVDIGSII